MTLFEIIEEQPQNEKIIKKAHKRNKQHDKTNQSPS